MTEPDLNQISDGGVLRELAGGLVIIRRMKHEWRDELNAMALEKLAVRTGKKWGASFFATWTLDRLVEWIGAQVAAAGWQRRNVPFAPLDVLLDEAVGLADGNRVYTIRIVCDGHYLHAYPVKD